MLEEKVRRKHGQRSMYKEAWLKYVCGLGVRLWVLSGRFYMRRPESPDVVEWSACMRRDVQGVGTHLRSETGRETIEKWIWAGDDGKVFGKIHYI